jgi:PAS domain S-box-containing protein
MLDPDGRVASWNAGAQRIKGYRADDIIGQHFRIFYPPDMQAIGHPEHELELALSRGSYEEEGWRLRKDGSRFWASVVITAVFGPDREHIGFAKVTRDIDERRRMLLDAEQAAADLAVANAELATVNERLVSDAADQAQFLAVTAHELRSPVSVLSGSAQLLVDHWAELEENERDDLSASMRSSAGRLQRLLSDLLTASRLGARAIRLSMSDVDLADVLARAVSAARAAAPDAGIELDAPSNLWVNGEADRLAQAFDNLLDNARLHGVPPVRVRARSLGDRVEVVISDSGAGVSPEFRERLFTRFATGRSGIGTGLGLYIVRELARVHGGDAWYEPTPDGGASFVFTLPARGTSDH